jgi:hypothetical protein
MTELPPGDRKFIGFVLPAFDSSQKVPHISRRMPLFAMPATERSSGRGASLNLARGQLRIRARVADGRIAQRVHTVDGDGMAWEALYTLEQQPDGSLKFTGCTLLKAGQAV